MKLVASKDNPKEKVYLQISPPPPQKKNPNNQAKFPVVLQSHQLLPQLQPQPPPPLWHHPREPHVYVISRRLHAGWQCTMIFTLELYVELLILLTYMVIFNED